MSMHLLNRREFNSQKDEQQEHIQCSPTNWGMGRVECMYTLAQPQK